jgi:serine/threonine-protein kinase ULK/ATG1
MLFYELLYGVTPWNASTQTNLAKAITTKELSFPETPKRSQIVKDILSKMLVVKEEDRISWYELFESNLIKSDESKILLEI